MISKYFDSLIADLGWVDNYKFTYNIREKRVTAVFYTTTEIKPEDEEFDTLIFRCLEAQEKLGVDINWSTSVSTPFFARLFRRLVKCLRDQKLKL